MHDVSCDEYDGDIFSFVMQIGCIVGIYLCIEHKKEIVMVNQHYATFYIAGFSYWDGLEVFDELRVGMELRLEAEPLNGYDPNAVKILFHDTLLGYVPREENEELSKFLQLGHTELFSAKISRINPEAHPEKQICVTLKINKKERG
jgi:HIRAN domain-containing protein